MKKIKTPILVAVLLAFVLAGCTPGKTLSPNTETSSSSKTETTSATQETVSPASKSALPFAETLKIKQAEIWRPENESEVLTYKVLEERLNMQIEYIQIPEATSSEQFAMLLASGDLPDVVDFNSPIYADWIKYEAIIPLDDLLKEYAPDYLSRLTDEDFKYLRSPDGVMYHMASIERDVAKTVGAYSLCVRKDWLDNLGLGMPVTLAEWEAAFTAFKNNDPNGNGKNDEIPFVGTFEPIWDAYGLGQLYVLNDDNTLTWKYVDKYFLEAVSTLASWYEKGLIDQEYITRNKNKTEVQAIVYNGIAGARRMTGNHTTAVTKSLREAGIENALFVASTLIEGPRGRNVAARNAIPVQARTITVQAKEKEKIMQYLNYPFTDEGIELFNYGVEGITYDVVGDKKVIKQDIVESGWNELRRYGVNKVGGPRYYNLADTFLQMTFMGQTADSMDEITKLAYDAYTNKDVLKYSYQAFPTTLNQVKSYIEYDGAILVKELEDMTDQVIMGIKSIEDLKKLIDEIYADSFKQIEAEVNEYWKVISK